MDKRKAIVGSIAAAIPEEVVVGGFRILHQNGSLHSSALNSMAVMNGGLRDVRGKFPDLYLRATSIFVSR